MRLTIDKLYGEIVALMTYCATSDVEYLSSTDCANRFKNILETIKAYKKEFLELLPEREETTKKIKALKIIKSKEMLSVFKDTSGKCFIVFNTTAIEIPQEEYGVLEEVLL